MKRIITASLVATLALTGVQAESVTEKLNSLETELAKVKKDLKKQKETLSEVKAHDSGDNIKWGADLRTSIDNINYDMANGNERGKNDLMATRLWLNMAYAPNANNVFKGQLSYNKAWGADFTGNTGNYPRGMGMDSFDWVGNEALTDSDLKVRQAYWLYLGEKAFGLDMPWTFSLGRRPSTNGFLANLRDDDPEQSPLGHIINVEFDGLSSKLDLSRITGVPGMSFKLCMGQGSTNAAPMFSRLDSTQYSDESNGVDSLEDVQLGGFIIEPYNDGQIITKATWFRAYNMPGYDNAAMMAAMTGGQPWMSQVGDLEGGAFSVLVDGVTEDGYFSDVKVFGSIAYSKTRPDSDSQMLGMMTSATTWEGAAPGESKTGTSYWLGANLPVNVGDENYGTFGVEYNHGSRYWRPVTYAEDTMIGSKLAARGDAWEAYYTYQISEALSAQFRYTAIEYDYAGSNAFFASAGTPIKMDDIKAGLWGPDMAAKTVEKAQDARFYLRYRF